MWKETIKPLLGSVLTSKKALALIAGAIVWALAQAGVVATPDAVLPLLGIISMYIFGQGIADNGKEAQKVLVDGLGKPQPPAESRGKK